MDEEEIWVELRYYPNYAVSNYGDVKNVIYDRLLTPRDNGRGYLRVALVNSDGDVEEVYIHQLVGEAFFAGFKRGMHITHDNRNLQDNRAINLIIRGSERKPERGQKALWGRHLRIVETGEIFRTVRDCANYIGGDYSCIYSVLRGDRSHHLGYTFEYVEV